MSKKIYTLEYVTDIVNTCDSIREVRENYTGVYDAMCRNGWLNIFPHLKRELNIFEDTKYTVYAFCFKETKTVYVGLTIDINRRTTEHLYKHCNSPVYKYATENNLRIPKVQILRNELTPIESLETEDYYVNKFKKEGWNILNKGKTGVQSGSLGTVGNGKLTYSYVYQQALKYKSLKDFREYSNTAYQKAVKEGWLDEYDWLVVDVDKRPKLVVQLNEIGNCEALHQSISSAAKSLGLKSKSSITNVLVGKSKTANKHRFLYYNDYERWY